MPVLVTGATGNVGRAVVSALRRLEIPLVAASSDPDRPTDLPEDAEVRRLDFLNPGSYDEALREVRGLFLLRPPPSPTCGRP